MTSETIEFPSGERHDVLAHDDERLVIEFTTQPTDAPNLPHVHERSDERFDVLGGAIRFTVGDVTRVLGPGDSVDIPRGAVHSWQALAPLHARVEFTPGCEFHAFLRDYAALIRIGRTNAAGRPGMRDFALMQRRHWRDLRIATVPAPVMRVAVAAGVALAALTRRRLPTPT
jgi:Cupin domain